MRLVGWGCGVSSYRFGAMLCAFLLFGAAPARADLCPIPQDGQAQLLVIFDLVNARRMQFGLQPLQSSIDLTLSAQSLACHMVATDTFGHSALGGTAQRVRAAGCTTPVSGETIAKGPLTGVEVVDVWMKSTHYRSVILMERASHIGLGVAIPVDGSGGPRWVLNVSDGC